MENLTCSMASEPSSGLDEPVELKIKKVLTYMVSNDFNVSDVIVLRKLFDAVSKLYKMEDCHGFIVRLCMPFMATVAQEWKNLTPHSQSFALNTMSLLCSQESSFSKLIDPPILPNICTHLKSGDQMSSKIAYLNVAKEMISHTKGLEWLWETGEWREVLKISREDKSLYTLQTSHNILADFVVSFRKQNLSACHAIINEIFAPCLSIPEAVNFRVISNEPGMMKSMPYRHEHFEGNLSFLNSINLLREIVLKMLCENLTYAEIQSIIGKYNFEEWLCKSITDSINIKVVAELSRFFSVINVASLPHLSDGSVKYSDMRHLCEQFLNHCSLLIQKREFILIQDLCIYYLKLWNRYGGEVVPDVTGPEVDPSNAFAIENTIFVLLTMPLFIFIREGNPELGGLTDVMEAYAEKVFGIACLQTKRTAYFYKKEVLECKSGVNIETLASSSVQCFIRIASICKKEQAIMIFQTLVYILRKVVPVGDVIKVPENVEVCYGVAELDQVNRSRNLLFSTIGALKCYISNFNLSWSDSLETIAVMPLLQKLLTLYDIYTNMTVSILQLLKVVLLSYLPANMALLMNTLQGTSTAYIGRQLYKRIHSVHWEIRDSAIELLEVVCALSEKMPAFQKVILDSRLPSLVVSTFENDAEPYVRASAASCLSVIVKIPDFWEDTVSNGPLTEKILRAVLAEPEGIVRHKSILLLKDLYNCRQLRSDEVEKIMDTLYHISMTDLHWEVRRGAIQFWDCILEKKLAEEGMLDGHFPDHLFSREKRKIIKLTASEISLRIGKVLESLGDLGCLYALWDMVQDESDLEVTKEAGKLIMKIIDLINKFNVDINKPSTSHEGPGDSDKTGVKRKKSEEEMDNENGNGTPIEANSDEVIESIISEGDINLVCGLLRSMDSEEAPRLRAKRKLPLDEFYAHVTSFDVIGVHLERSRWLHKTSDGLGCVLSDILAANKKKDIISDCY